MARAPVSKTGGWGFETLHPCQRRWAVGRCFWVAASGKMRAMALAIDPAKFVREVRAEVAKVTWPSRKETLITTGLVFALSGLAALFFFVADQVIGVGVRALFGVGI